MDLCLDLGTACNNRCVFCIHLAARQTGWNMTGPSFEYLTEAMAEGRRLGSARCHLQGGEPTLRKDLPDLIHEAARHGFQEITITTNGRRLAYADYLRGLIRAGLTGVVVSIHGVDSEHHDALSGATGASEQTASGLWNILETRRSTREKPLTLGINTVIQRSNQHELEELLAVAARYEAQSHLFLLYLPQPGFVPLETQGLLPDLSLLSQQTGRLLTLGDTLGVRVKFAHLPACLLPRDVSLKPVLAHAAAGAVKHQALQCKYCTAQDICPGIPTGYLLAQGESMLHPAL